MSPSPPCTMMNSSLSRFLSSRPPFPLRRRHSCSCFGADYSLPACPGACFRRLLRSGVRHPLRWPSTTPATPSGKAFESKDRLLNRCSFGAEFRQHLGDVHAVLVSQTRWTQTPACPRTTPASFRLPLGSLAEEHHHRGVDPIPKLERRTYSHCGHHVPRF